MTALVTMEHVRTLGYRERTDGKTFCASGVREWCARHSIDYLELVHQGIAVDRMRSTDGWGVMLAELAEGDTDGQQ